MPYALTQHFDVDAEIDGALYRDTNGVIRKYMVTAGSGDSIGTAEYYFDKKGVPRFTYRTRGASNGTRSHLLR